MSKLKVSNEVDVYEVDGEEQVGIDRPKVRVLSHWNRSEFVVIELGKKKLTVEANALRRAIANASNA